MLKAASCRQKAAQDDARRYTEFSEPLEAILDLTVGMNKGRLGLWGGGGGGVGRGGSSNWLVHSLCMDSMVSAWWCMDLVRLAWAVGMGCGCRCVTGSPWQVVWQG